MPGTVDLSTDTAPCFRLVGTAPDFCPAYKCRARDPQAMGSRTQKTGRDRSCRRCVGVGATRSDVFRCRSLSYRPLSFESHSMDQCNETCCSIRGVYMPERYCGVDQRVGTAIFHDARVFPGGWPTPADGPVKVVKSLFRDARFAGWRIVEEVHSMVVVQREQ